MSNIKSNEFSKLSSDLCNLLYNKNYNVHSINILIDKLNALNYKRALFVCYCDASPLITAICHNIKPTDITTVAKATHLINHIISHQNLTVDIEQLHKILDWDLLCLSECTCEVVVDILQSLLTVLQYNSCAGHQYKDQLLSKNETLLNMLEDPTRINKKLNLPPDIKSTVQLITVKSIQIMTVLSDNVCNCDMSNIELPILRDVCVVIVKMLYSIRANSDSYNYCKIVIYSLRTLSQIFLSKFQTLDLNLQDVLGLCKYYMFYGLLEKTAGSCPQRIAPSQQTTAEIVVPEIRKKGEGKKQKKRKPRNSAMDDLKRDSEKKIVNDIERESQTGYQAINKEMTDSLMIRFNTWVITSESDISDVEGGRELKILALEARVRQAACNLLLVLVKECDKRIMFGYWSAFLPDTPNPEKCLTDQTCQKTLTYVAANDPTSMGRCAALSVILAMLTGSKLYLHQAEYIARETPFTTFSQYLGRVCTCVHTVLTLLLTREHNVQSIIMTLKCTAAILYAAPYHRLKDGLLMPLINAVKRHLMHKDTNIQVSALIVIGSLISIDPPIKDIILCLTKDEHVKSTNKLPEKTKNCTNIDITDGIMSDNVHITIRPTTTLDDSNLSEIVNDTQYSDVEYDEFYEDDIFVEYHSSCRSEDSSDIVNTWIFDLCLKNLGWIIRGGKLTKCLPSTIPVMLESLQVLSALSTYYFSTVLRNRVDIMVEVLASLLCNGHQKVELHAVKCTAAFGEAMLKLEQDNEKCVPLSVALNFWSVLLGGPLAKLSSTAGDIIPALCDAFTGIGERVFSKLQSSVQVLIVSLLLGWCENRLNDEYSIRSTASVRALGHLVLYRQLREDPCFIQDVCTCACRSCLDVQNTHGHRARAIWTLAALTDALLINREEGDIEDQELNLLLEILETSIICINDNEKIKVNATRAIGNVLRLIIPAHLEHSKVSPLIRTAVQSLINNCRSSSNMKMRWNSCYAVGNAMKNDVVYHFDGLKKEAFNTLCAQMIECKNIKVRITAAVALRSIRNTDGDSSDIVGHCINSCTKAFDTANNLHHYAEYIHRDNLLEQLCVTFSHLCCQLTSEILVDILDNLNFHHELIRNTLSQCVNRLAPESCSQIMSAVMFVTTGLPAPEGQLQAQALSILHNIFIWD